MYVERNELNPGELTLLFYGDWDKRYQERVEELCLSDFVETHDFVPHDEIIPVLKGSDIVVHVGGDDSQNELSIPSKIWDYIGARTPMLAVVDPSFRVACLIEENSLGIAVHPEDADGIAESIERILSGGFEYTPDETVFDEFSRANKMDVLAKILDSVSVGDPYTPKDESK